MAKKNKLSIYLLKKGIFLKEDIFKNPGEIKELEKYGENSIAYFRKSNVYEPSWLATFFLKDEVEDICQANSRVVLIKKITIDNEEITFALTFGYAKSLFKDNVLEEQFGLKIILNTIKQNEIRKISKTSVGTNQKQSNEQLPKSSSISEFGFDINRDLIKNISGKSEDEMFESSMLTGGDIFSLTVNRDIQDIDDFLVYCYRRYKDDSYLDSFKWVDNIKYIRDKDLISSLNLKLIEEINSKKFMQVWMAVPDVIDWVDIKGFKIQGDDSLYGDIEIEKVIATIRKALTSVEQLKSKKIRAISSMDDSEVIHEWSAFNCIIAEISVDGYEYCLSNGKWYKINSDFVKEISNKYDEIELLEDKFIDFNHQNEDEYNEELVENLDGAVLLHKVKISTGGQGESIEPCDVFWKNKIIHIKKNGGSSLLSHLFNQALVSSQMWLDVDLRKQLISKANKRGFKLYIPDKFVAGEYEIVIAIINDFDDERPKIPFFSKVSICYAIKNILGFGFKVSLKNIRNLK